MTPAPARSPEQRKADTLAKLAAVEADVWVASASADDDGADPYLVPLSLSWLDERIVIALQGSSRTARNISTGGVARLALGATRDVVMIDVTLERSVPVGADDGLDRRYAAQADWDPRGAGGGYVLLVLRPTRIQAWREENELADRTVMRDGHWLV
jgi:hypothetical protein